MPSETSLTLLISDDTPDGFVRLDATDARFLGANPDDIVVLEGSRRSFVRLLPAFMEDRNQKIARVSPLTARNIGTLHGRSIRVVFDKAKAPAAERVTIEASNDFDRLHLTVRLDQLGMFWQQRVITAGDELLLPTLDRHPLLVRVFGSQPSGLSMITRATTFAVAAGQAATGADLPLLGGLRDLAMACRDITVARFRRTGENGTGAVLLSGPAGCGKALLVKRLAGELGASLKILDVHHLVDQFLVTGAVDSGVTLSEMVRRGSTVLLIDHLEALAACRDNGSLLAKAGNVVCSQIASLLEELPTQPNIAVFLVSSGDVDERLLKGPFLFRLDVDLPNRWGRQEILLVAAAGRKMAPDVDLASLAGLAVGMNARDLVGLFSAAAAMADEQPITQANLVAAFRAFSVPLPGPVRCDIPDVAWDDIAGLDDVKKSLLDVLSWSSHGNERMQSSGMEPPRSVLLSGSLGTGKTTLVRALAGRLPIHFIEVSCLLLVTRNEAEAKKVARDVFALARRKVPCLVFLDDVDALFEGTASPEDAVFSHPVVEQLMAELDAMTGIPGVVVIAATNRLDRLSNEILRVGRFDFSLALPLPDAPARKKIFHACLKNKPVAADVDFDGLASVTHGFSPAEIAALCNRVALMAFRRSFSGTDGGVIPPVLDAGLFDQEMRGRK